MNCYVKMVKNNITRNDFFKAGRRGLVAVLGGIVSLRCAMTEKAYEFGKRTMTNEEPFLWKFYDDSVIYEAYGEETNETLKNMIKFVEKRTKQDTLSDEIRYDLLYATDSNGNREINLREAKNAYNIIIKDFSNINNIKDFSKKLSEKFER